MEIQLCSKTSFAAFIKSKTRNHLFQDRCGLNHKKVKFLISF